jgi:hypothetical protein
MVECRTPNPDVGGSSPSWPAIAENVSKLLRCLYYDSVVGGTWGRVEIFITKYVQMRFCIVANSIAEYSF